MKRVLVLGNGGTGKSTVSLAIGERLGLPVIHLDQHYWLPSWTERDPDEWRQLLATLLAGDRWVMDGNFRNTLPQRLERATHAVFLDLPRRVAIPSVLYRRIRYAGRGRVDLPAGCTETANLGFLRYLWDYPTRSRPAVVRILDETDVPVTRLTSRRAVDRWLRDLPDQREQDPGGDR